MCFCCLSEGAKVGRVLEKFPALPASQAQPGLLQKVVGRVVLASQMPFYAPGSGKPCVYYHVKVEQEFEDIRRDAEGNTHSTYRWQTVVEDERFVDFYLQDGAHKVYVRGSDRAHCKIQGSEDRGRSSGLWNQPPPGIRALIMFRLPQFTWHGMGRDIEFATGRYRYTEASFDVNELVAGLGVVQAATDAMGQSLMMLVPFNERTLDDAYFQQNNWSDFDKRSWHDLLKEPAVLLSDKPHFTSGVMIQPITFPPQMAYQMAVVSPAFNGWAAQWQQPEAFAIAQPVPVAMDMNRGMGGGGGYGTMNQPFLG